MANHDPFRDSVARSQSHPALGYAPATDSTDDVRNPLQVRSVMRWFVEVSRVGDVQAAERYCVEAKAWQAALQEARKLRGDSGPLSKFSIELLDDGYRAVDPVQKIRYLVNQAPADAPLAAAVLGAANGSEHRSAAALVPSAPAAAPEAAAPATSSSAAAAAAPPLTAPPAAVLEPAPELAQQAAPIAAPAVAQPAPSIPTPAVATAPAIAAPAVAAPAQALPNVVSGAPEASAATASAVPRAPEGALPRPSIPRPSASRPPPEGPASAPVIPRPAAVPSIEPASGAELPAAAASPVLAAPPASSVAPARVIAVAPSLAEGSAAAASLADASAVAPSSTNGAASHPATLHAALPRPAAVTSSDVTTLPGPAVAPIGAESLALPNGGRVEYQLLRSRTEEPSPEAPITYREAAFAVAPGTPRAAVEALLYDRLAAVKAELSSRQPGQLVQLAVFDHVFEQRPLHAPLGTLAWKDWRGEPVVGFPGFGEAPPPVTASVAPPPVAPATQATAPVVGASPAQSAAVVADVPAAERRESAAAGAAAPHEGVSAVTPLPGGGVVPTAGSGARTPTGSVPIEPAQRAVSASANGAPEVQKAPVERSSRPRLIVAKRRIGEDLIGELFEIMHELHFARDLAIGADFVQGVLADVIPTEIALLQVFDINKRQFVVVRARGGGAERAILHRTADNDPLLVDIMRREGARSQQAKGDPRFASGRWSFVNVPVAEVLSGPARQGGRYLGTIEIANPLGGTPFHQSEVNAFDYICEQFADFVASRPIVLDADVILPR